MNNKKARVIAFYLPQFHPIPENDEWWGKGFTEWTNVGKAKPLFKGHYQPKIPADLGYYDLRMPDVREAQAELARNAGVEGFMYWHYWFGNGKRLLADIFDDVLSSGKPDFPFCLGWANHSWYAKNWNSYGADEDKLLIEQEYPGERDYIEHFYTVLKAFKDKRYIRINGKPLFLIYAPFYFEEVSSFIDLWQKLARENGLTGIHFIGQALIDSDYLKLKEKGFDAVCRQGLKNSIDKISNPIKNKILGRLRTKYDFIPINTHDYKKISMAFIDNELYQKKDLYPTILPNFDHSPRSGRNGLILKNSTPEAFQKHVRATLNATQNKDSEENIIFLRSWNEWAEGNYMEPDMKFGKQYIDALNKEINKK